MANSNVPEQLAPPALPQATNDYDRRFQDQFSNVLRLFFNRLSTGLNALLSPAAGGATLFKPHGTFYSAADQVAGAINTPVAITFPSTFNVSSLGIEVNGGAFTEINVTYPGVYYFNLTAQIVSKTGAGGEIYTWVNKNGTDVPFSAQINSFAGTGTAQMSHVFTLDIKAGDTLIFYWSTDTTHIHLETTAAGSPPPAVPSASLTIVFASNLLT